MPPEMGFAYSQLSYQEKIGAAGRADASWPRSCLVFLLLAALYESWRLPWAVLLGSPLVVLGAFFGVWLARLRQQRLRADRQHHADRSRGQERHPDRRVRQGEARGGHERRGGGAQSARLRFRPILMTAFAFILGVIPLMKASGAGAGAQNVMGTAVFWGMLVATGARGLPHPGQLRLRRELGRKKKKSRPPPREVTDMRRTLVLLVGLAAVAAGCAVGPNYHRPDLAPPPAWEQQPAPAESSLANLPWWDLFQDQALRDLIHTALAENKDRKLAMARIAEARAALGSRARISCRASTTRARRRAARRARRSTHRPAARPPTSSCSAPRSAYEADLWGRYRRSTEAAQADLLATDYAYRSVTLQLGGRRREHVLHAARRGCAAGDLAPDACFAARVAASSCA